MLKRSRLFDQITIPNKLYKIANGGYIIEHMSSDVTIKSFLTSKGKEVLEDELLETIKYWPSNKSINNLSEWFCASLLSPNTTYDNIISVMIMFNYHYDDDSITNIVESIHDRQGFFRVNKN